MDREIFFAKRLEYCRTADTAKADYHRFRIEAADTKKPFGIVDELIGSKKALANVAPSNIPLAELPGVFSRFFDDKVSKLVEGLPVHKEFGNVVLPTYSFSEFTAVTEEAVTSLIISSSTKTCILDSLPTIFIQQCVTHLSPFITQLFNSSLLSGIVPQDFKKVVVKPLIKKPDLDANILKNYRSVSNIRKTCC